MFISRARAYPPPTKLPGTLSRAGTNLSPSWGRPDFFLRPTPCQPETRRSRRDIGATLSTLRPDYQAFVEAGDECARLERERVSFLHLPHYPDVRGIDQERLADPVLVGFTVAVFENHLSSLIQLVEVIEDEPGPCSRVAEAVGRGVDVSLGGVGPGQGSLGLVQDARVESPLAIRVYDRDAVKLKVFCGGAHYGAGRRVVAAGSVGGL